MNKRNYSKKMEKSIPHVDELIGEKNEKSYAYVEG